jgi:hypothetical protein
MKANERRMEKKHYFSRGGWWYNYICISVMTLLAGPVELK